MIGSFEMPEINNREMIEARLRTRGLSLAHIADQLGLTVGTVSSVVSGQRKSKRVEAEIARALDTDEKELWEFSDD